MSNALAVIFAVCAIGTVFVLHIRNVQSFTNSAATYASVCLHLLKRYIGVYASIATFTSVLYIDVKDMIKKLL